MQGISREDLVGTKVGNIINKFVYSDLYFILLCCIVVATWYFNLLIIVGAILIVAMSFLLIVKRDVSPVLAIVMVITSIISIKEIPDYLVYLWPLAVLIFGAIIAHMILYPIKEFKFGRLTMPYIAITIVGFLGGIGSKLPQSIKGNIFSVLFIMVLPMVVYILAKNYIKMPEDKSIAEYVAKMVFYFGVIVTIEIALYYIKNLDYVRENPYSVVHLGWAISNTASTVLLFSMPMGVYLYTKTNGIKSLLYLGSSLVQFLAIAATTSRGSLLIGGLELVFIVIGTFFACKGKKRIEYIYILGILFVMAFSLGYICWDKIVRIYNIIFIDGLGDSGRFQLYMEAIECFKQSPIFGAGFGYLGNWTRMNTQIGTYQFHNTLLQVLGCLGTVGMLGYVYYYIERVKMLFEKWDIFNLFIMMAYFGFEGYSMLNTGTIQGFPFLTMVSIMTVAIEENSKLEEYQHIQKLKKLIRRKN